MLEEFVKKVNSEMMDQRGLYLPGFLRKQDDQYAHLNEENCVAYADDLVFLINFITNQYYLDGYLKLFCTRLVEVSEKWGLSINGRKSGIMHFRSSLKNHIKRTLPLL